MLKVAESRIKGDNRQRVCMHLLKEHSGLDNKRIGKVFGVSLSAVTKAAQRISEQLKTQGRLKKEIDQISYYISSIGDPQRLPNYLMLLH